MPSTSYSYTLELIGGSFPPSKNPKGQSTQDIGLSYFPCLSEYSTSHLTFFHEPRNPQTIRRNPSRFYDESDLNPTSLSVLGSVSHQTHLTRDRSGASHRRRDKYIESTRTSDFVSHG